MSVVEKWSEAEFEARVRELDVVGQAFSRAYAHISGIDEEEEEEVPLSLRDWLSPPKEEEEEEEGYGKKKRSTNESSQRAVEVRLERMCADHERRLDALYEKYSRELAEAVAPRRREEELSVEQDLQSEESDEEELQDFRSFAEELQRRRLTNHEASRKKQRIL